MFYVWIPFICLSVCLSFNALFGNMFKFCLNYDVIACIINTTNQCSCCLIVYNNLTLSMCDVGWHCCLANFMCGGGMFKMLVLFLLLLLLVMAKSAKSHIKKSTKQRQKFFMWINTICEYI